MAKNVWPFKAFHLLKFKRNMRNAVRCCCMGNTKDSEKLNLDVNTKDNSKCPRSLLLYLFPIRKLTFRTFKKYDCPFRLQIWIYFLPMRCLFDPVLMSDRKIMLWWKWNMLFDFLIHIYSTNVIRRKWYSRFADIPHLF